MTRGFRNNNPGNIRHSPTTWMGQTKGNDKAFKRFESMAWGVRAMFHLLNNYRLFYGTDTIEKMIARYAPTNENDTEAYIRAVAERSGVARNSRITTTNRDVMEPVVVAMIAVENAGAKVTASEMNEGWELFLKHKK